MLLFKKIEVIPIYFFENYSEIDILLKFLKNRLFKKIIVYKTTWLRWFEYFGRNRVGINQ